MRVVEVNAEWTRAARRERRFGRRFIFPEFMRAKEDIGTEEIEEV